MRRWWCAELQTALANVTSGSQTQEQVAHGSDPSCRACLSAPLNVQAVHQLFIAAKSSNLPAAREKYASAKFAQVSQLGCPACLPEWMFL
jgi:hypothetical protein